MTSLITDSLTATQQTDLKTYCDHLDGLAQQKKNLKFHFYFSFVMSFGIMTLVFQWYIPRIMHIVYAMLSFAVVLYQSDLLISFRVVREHVS